MEIKPPRFMQEYASYQKDKIQSEKMMLDMCKRPAVHKIDSAVRNFSRGLITVGEAMNMICNPFDCNLDNLNKVELVAFELDS